MAPKRWTLKEIRAASAVECRTYFANHPKEKEKYDDRMRRKEERDIARRMAKHQPVIADIQSNGEYVTVEFTRKDGVRCYGDYKLFGGAHPIDTATAIRETYA